MFEQTKGKFSKPLTYITQNHLLKHLVDVMNLKFLIRLSKRRVIGTCIDKLVRVESEVGRLLIIVDNKIILFESAKFANLRNITYMR